MASRRVAVSVTLDLDVATEATDEEVRSLVLRHLAMLNVDIPTLESRGHVDSTLMDRAG